MRRCIDASRVNGSAASVEPGYGPGFHVLDGYGRSRHDGPDTSLTTPVMEAVTCPQPVPEKWNSSKSNAS